MKRNQTVYNILSKLKQSLRSKELYAKETKVREEQDKAYQGKSSIKEDNVPLGANQFMEG